MKSNGRNTVELTSAAVPAGSFSSRFLLVAAVFLLPFLISCGEAQNRRALAQRMAEEEGAAGNDERIAELKSDIRGVEKQVEKTIEAVKDRGTYWRLLGLKYMDYRMWGEALSAFDEAVSVYPDNAALLYNRALTAGQMALSADTEEVKTDYFTRAENGYRRAIEVDPRYTPSLYALSVLLVFELGRPLEAAPLLQDFLKIERSNINGRFLLARVYLEAGMKSDALDLYDEIIKLAKDKTDALKAEELYNRVAGGGNGS